MAFPKGGLNDVTMLGGMHSGLRDLQAAQLVWQLRNWPASAVAPFVADALRQPLSVERSDTRSAGGCIPATREATEDLRCEVLVTSLAPLLDIR